MENFRPAFEVTRVDSMQWNRTVFADKIVDAPGAAAVPLSSDVISRLRESIRKETAHVKR